MKIVITGARGFIGSNLWHQAETCGHEVSPFARSDSLCKLDKMLSKADAVVHLAGENRPKEKSQFHDVNVVLTQNLCKLISEKTNIKKMIFASSIQAIENSPYGISKKRGEEAIENLSQTTSIDISIYRLSNVFGKWSRPNYNSVVATFCHNILHDQPIEIRSGDKKISLIYIDDLVANFLKNLEAKFSPGLKYPNIKKVYKLTVNQLAKKIEEFKSLSETLTVGTTASGFERALYATYLSYLEPKTFARKLKINADERGIFVEMLKTKSSGQFAFFTLTPGQSRGGHYHNTKNEKFVILKGHARFNFKNILSNELISLNISDEEYEIITTAPGWSHEIVNAGLSDVFGVVWANEIYDPINPDTIEAEVRN